MHKSKMNLKHYPVSMWAKLTIYAQRLNKKMKVDPIIHNNIVVIIQILLLTKTTRAPKFVIQSHHKTENANLTVPQ